MNDALLSERIASQRALRAELLETLYRRRADHPGRPWLHTRTLAEGAGTDVAFALGVLEELGQIERHGYTWRITAAGALVVEEAVK